MTFQEKKGIFLPFSCNILWKNDNVVFDSTTIEVGLNLDILAKFICGARIEDLYRSQPRDTTSAIKLNVNYNANKWAKASLNIGKYILRLRIQPCLGYQSFSMLNDRLTGPEYREWNSVVCSTAVP